MIRTIFLISLAIVVGARHVDRPSVDGPEESHNLGWLFSEDPEHLKSTSAESTSERSVCQTEQCKDIARILLESMNKSADPCENFYEFNCGNWAKYNKPKSPEVTVWNPHSALSEKIEEEISDMLVAPAKSDDFIAVKMIKKWYAACMDTDSIEKRGLEPFVSTLAGIGGWPLAMEPEMWDADIFTWQRIDDYYARLLGMNVFHDLHVNEVSENNETTFQLTIGVPALSEQVGVLLILAEAIGRESVKSCEENSNDDDDDDDDDRKRKIASGENDHNGNDSHVTNTMREIIKGDSVNEDTDEQINRRIKNRKLRGYRKNHVDRSQTHIKAENRNQTQAGHKNKASVIRTKTGHKKVAKKMTENHIGKQVHKLLKNRTKRGLLPKIVHHTYHNVVNKRKQKSIRKRKSRKGRLNKPSSDETETTTQSTVEDDDDEDTDDDLPRLKDYFELVSQVAVAIAEVTGSEIDIEKVHEDIEDMTTFQVELALLNLLPVSSDAETMSLESFQEWYDHLESTSPNAKVDWAGKVKDLLSEANVNVDSSQEIVVKTKYFKALKTLLEKTPTRAIVNYVHWAYISNMLEASTQKMNNLYEKWMDAIKEFEPDSSRKTRSTDDSNNKRQLVCLKEKKIFDLVEYEYVKHYFTDEIRQFASDMIDDIQKEVEYQIKEAQWMDEETRDMILSKLVRMKKDIGYPDWYKNETLVKRHLQGITVGSSYFENMLSYKRFEKWENLRRIVKGSTDVTADVLFSPIDVNAFFFPEQNSLSITAADFRAPYFSFGRPNNVNFPLAGTTLGHEVNHGFDNTGYAIDKDGKNVKLLEQMKTAYNQRAECFIHQYDRYAEEIAPNVTENYGESTLDENIADTMGLQAAYKAYKRRERECRKVADSLPGMEEFSNDQIFFLAYGYTWCEWLGTENIEDTLRDVHSIGRLRLIGSVSNLEEFAEAFKCPVGSPMNPKEKCNIWK